MVNDLVGQIIEKIVVNKDESEITFYTKDGKKYLMCHIQDCCENVYVADIIGDLDDLIETPILVAEGRSSDGVHGALGDVIFAQAKKSKYEDESCTWTFYSFRTVKGSVDIRWCGTSNGYYSEGVDFFIVP